VQNRYAGDVGDYVKLALLRALAPGLRLGVAWYLYPNEGHNSDGRHTAFLSQPGIWRHLDPQLFDGLRKVTSGRRSVAALQALGLLDAVFAGEPLRQRAEPSPLRSNSRAAWFDRQLRSLDGCELVFADPDNGLTDNNPSRRSSLTFGKQLPLQEALALAEGRSAVIYHHNSRFKGGHAAEVNHWRRLLGSQTIAVRANAYSCRTFLILNPTGQLARRAEAFCTRWSEHKVRLHGPG
jgi:hypothetical protein